MQVNADLVHIPTCFTDNTLGASHITCALYD